MRAATSPLVLLTQTYYLKWSLRSDSHRRLVVYETTPVAAEARRLEIFDFRLAIFDLRAVSSFQSAIENQKSKMKLVLSRGFAPRASAFAKRRAELITL